MLGALLAPLACAVVLALGVGRRAARWTGILLAAHPLLALGAGGALASTGALAAALLLAALLLLARRGPVGRRVGLFLLVLLPLAEPPCVAYVPFLLVAWWSREPSRRWRVAGLVLALATLVATPFPARGHDGDVGSRVLAFGLQWAPAALLLGLLPFLPAGIAHAWRVPGAARPVVRAWLAGAGVHVLLLLLLQAPPGFAFGWEGLTTGVPLVPLGVALGLVGLARLAAARRRTVVRALLGGAVAASVFCVIGPLQTWWFPGSTPPAGRLWRLARVVGAAGDAAGPAGWVAFDVGSALDACETERLGDLLPGRRTGTLQALPLADLAADLAIVSRYRPEVLDVVTLGGQRHLPPVGGPAPGALARPPGRAPVALRRQAVTRRSGRRSARLRSPSRSIAAASAPTAGLVVTPWPPRPATWKRRGSRGSNPITGHRSVAKVRWPTQRWATRQVAELRLQPRHPFGELLERGGGLVVDPGLGLDLVAR